MFESAREEGTPGPALQHAASTRLARACAGASALLDQARRRRLRPRDPGVELARIADMAPSPYTLAALNAINVERLDAHDRVTWLGLWERHRGWFDARAQAGIVAVGGAAPPPAHRLQSDSNRDDIGREHVALALRLSSATGGDRLDVARELAGRLDRTLAALGRGELTYWHAKAVADGVASLEDPAALAVERIVLDGAPAFETITQFRKRVDRAVIAADPKNADEQHEQALSTRTVIMWPEPHGMATVQATLTAAEAVTAMAALTALAHRSRADGDDRPVDALRADAFSRLFDAALADPHLPTQHRTRPRVGMTIDSATLMGLADHPGHLDGYGPIPPVMARRLAAEGDWHRLVTDPVSGALLDYGTCTYRPPADLAEYLVTRDRTCRFPTCSRQARLCDLDHGEPYDQSGQGQGGSTSAAGMGCLCRRNHRQKTAGDVMLVSHPDGSATWTTSAGHAYHRAAVDHCPEHTAHLAALRAQAAAEAGAEAAAQDRDAEAADQALDNHHTEDDNGGPGDDQAPAPPGGAHKSSAVHDTAAEHASCDSADTDTSSGNDPPPF